jgi:hypothetical protein
MKRKLRKKRKKVSSNQPFEVTGYHSCNKEIGLKVLNGQESFRPSKNNWDWLGPGLYFWEQNPVRALEYAMDSASGKQFNKVRIKTPFVLGSSIHLSKCLNLLEPRCAFQEGSEVYPSAPFTTQLHLQVCVCNLEMIKGYFLPLPLEDYNPYLHYS